MTRTKWQSIFIGLSIAIILLAWYIPASAQSPVDSALATLAAATSQARAADWRAQQQATRQAQSLAATTDAQAARAQATRQALAADATATVNAHAEAIAATRQAYDAMSQATVTAYAAAYCARATLDAQAAQATATVYAVSVAEIQRRSDIGTAMLYAAGALVIAWAVIAILLWARRRISQAAIVPQSDTIAQASTVVLDYETDWIMIGTMPPVSVMPPAQAAQVAGELDRMLEGQ